MSKFKLSLDIVANDVKIKKTMQDIQKSMQPILADVDKFVKSFEKANAKELKKSIKEVTEEIESADKASKDLTKEQQKTTKEVENLAKEQSKVTKDIEESVDSTKDLADGIDKASSNTEKVSKHAGVASDALEESAEQASRMESELSDAANKANTLGDSAEDTENNLGDATNEAKGLDNALGQANNELDDMSTKSKDVGENLKKAGDTLSKSGKFLTATVTAPIIAGGVMSFNAGADLEDASGAADQIFKGSSEEFKKFAREMETFYGISESEALEYGNTMGVMLQNIGGLSDSEAAKEAEGLLKLAGDLTSMFGGDVSGAVNALTGSLKGNNSMLDNYGMGINEAVINNKALEMGIIEGTEKLDMQAKQAVTLALIMEQTSAAQGQAAREADGASGSMRELMTEMKNLASDIGTILLPVVTPVVREITNIVKAFQGLPPESQKMILVVAGAIAVIGPLLMMFGSLLSVVATFTTAVALAGSVSAVLFSPVVLIVLAIVAAIGLVVAGIIVWYKHGDKIKAFFKQLGKDLGKFFTKLGEGITKFGDGMVSGFKKSVESVKGFFSNIGESATKGLTDYNNRIMSEWVKVGKSIKEAYDGWELSEHINKIFQNIKDFITGLKEPIAGFFAELGTMFEEVKVTLEGYVETFSQIWTKFTEGIEDFVNKAGIIFRGIKDSLDIFAMEIYTFVQSVANSIWGFLKPIFTFIGDGFTLIGEMFMKGVSMILDGLSWIGQSVFDFFYNNFSSVIKFLASIDVDFENLGKNIMQGLLNGLLAGVQGVINTVMSIGDVITGLWQQIFDIHSPSRFMKNFIGKNMMFGLGEGIMEFARNPLDAINSVSDEMSNSFSNIDALDGNYDATVSQNVNRMVDVSMQENARDKQPLNAYFTFGSNEFRAVVEDITNLQNANTEFEMAF